LAVVEDRYRGTITIDFESRVTGVDVQSGAATAASASGQTKTCRYDFLIGGDGTGSVVRKAMQEQIPGFTVESASYPNYCTMIELDRVGDRLDKHYLQSSMAKGAPQVVQVRPGASSFEVAHAESAANPRDPVRTCLDTFSS